MKDIYEYTCEFRKWYYDAFDSNMNMTILANTYYEMLLMSAKLIYVLSSFHMLFCAFYIHIHVKLIKFPLNLVL